MEGTNQMVSALSEGRSKRGREEFSVSGVPIERSDLGDGSSRHLRLYSAPADRAAPDSFLEGAEKYDVHHLAVIKPLQDQGSEERPVFIFFESEGDDAGEQVNQHEESEKDQRSFHILRGPQLRQLRDAKLRETP
jgi:hypothetical protein